MVVKAVSEDAQLPQILPRGPPSQGSLTEIAQTHSHTQIGLVKTMGTLRLEGHLYATSNRDQRQRISG